MGTGSKTFRLKAYSMNVYMVLFMISIVIIPLILRETNFLKDDKTGRSIFFLCTLALGIYIANRIGTAITVWTFDDNQVNIHWESQFIFHRKVDKNFGWDNIHGYKYESGKFFDLFYIKLKNGKKIKHYRENFFTKDNFDNFFNYFLLRVRIHNEKEEKQTLIKK